MVAFGCLLTLGKSEILFVILLTLNNPKKLFVILLTCFKSEKASHALENKKIFTFSLETFLQCRDFSTIWRLSVL